MMLIIAGLTTGLFVFSFIVMQMNLTSAEVGVNEGCLLMKDVRAIKPDFKVPAYFPTGYEYKCGIAMPGEAYVFFWDKAVDKTSYQMDVLNEASRSKGAILMRMLDRPELQNATSEVLGDYQMMIDGNSKLSPRLLEINGNPAWANEATSGAGTQYAQFPDGTVITRAYDMPARIRIYENGKSTHIEGFVPLEELQRIANSLQ